MFFCINIITAQTITSAASGDWNSTSTWAGGVVPVSTNNVVIGNHTVTVTDNRTCANLTTNPGTAAGSAKLIINNGFKLTITGTFSVLATNIKNDTYISGAGSIQAVTLNIGQTNFNPTAPGVTDTTLYIDQLTELKITGNIAISSRIDINAPTKTNAGRLRHRSGTIDLMGTLTASVTRGTNIQQSTGLSNLGYRTDNDNQGDSKIILRNTNPTIPASGDSTSNFTGGSIEFNSTSTTPYTLPSLSYKNLILNSNRTFITNNALTKIIENGKLFLLNGTLSTTNASTALGLDNNVEIIRTNGIIQNDISRLRLNGTQHQYNVTYNQHTNTITSSRELFSVVNSTPRKPSTVIVNTSNGVIFSDNVEVDIVNIIVPSAATAINSTFKAKDFKINAPNTIVLNQSGSLEVDNLEINATTTFNGSGSIKTSNTLKVTNGFALTLADNMLTLLSKSENTARVAPLLNGETISGIVNVQRYLPNNRRQWRLLTAPVKGANNNSVYFNWQLNGVSNYVDGTDIWGPVGTLAFNVNDQTISNVGNGLVNITDSSYNLRKWDNTTGAFSNVTNTIDEPLFNADKNFGFLSFFTHPFLQSSPGDGSYFGSQSSLNLSARGSLITGNVSYPDITNTKYYMIGNPYASPLNFASMLADSANQGVKKIWIIDPTVGPFGGYVTYDAVAGVYNNSGSSFNGSTELQSGQAFFVLAAGYGQLFTTSLIIKESHKSSNNTNTTLNRVNENQVTNSSSLFRVLLEKENGTSYSNMDGCVAVFYDSGSNSIDGFDGYKLSNPSENIALHTSSTSLSIEHRATVQVGDFLTVRLSNTSVGINYKLKLYTENFSFTGTAILQDLFLGTSTPISLDGSVFEYLYQVTTNSASTGNRFKIVFQAAPLGTNQFVTTNLNLYPNPANNQDVINVVLNSASSDALFNYKIYNTLGELVQSNDIIITNASGTIKLSSKLNSGIYFVQLKNNSTNDLFTKSIIIK